MGGVGGLITQCTLGYFKGCKSQKFVANIFVFTLQYLKSLICLFQLRFKLVNQTFVMF